MARAEQSGMMVLRLSDLTLFPEQAPSYSDTCPILSVSEGASGAFFMA